MKIITNTPQPASTDPLEMLAREAEQVGADADPAGEGGSPDEPQPIAALTNGQVLTMAFELIRETMCIVAGVASPKTTLSTDKLAPLGDAWGAVCDKHGLMLADVVGDYMVELKALALTVPVVMAAKNALAAEVAQLKARAEAAATPEPEPVTAP